MTYNKLKYAKHFPVSRRRESTIQKSVIYSNIEYWIKYLKKKNSLKKKKFDKKNFRQKKAPKKNSQEKNLSEQMFGKKNF